MTDTLPDAYQPGPDGRPGEVHQDEGRQYDTDLDIALDDAETVIDAGPVLGPPVDPPTRRTTFADVVNRADERRPIVPASLRSKAGRHSLLTLLVGVATHEALWQLTRAPKYAGKLALFAPWGLLVLVGRQLRWAVNPELTRLLQAASRDEVLDRGESLSSRAAKSRKARFLMLGGELLVVVVAGLLLWLIAPSWVCWLTALVAMFLLARVGRPVDKPILERAFNASRYVRLTAELTRNALVASGAGVKDPTGVKFNKEIYRDGPGYTAEVSLPTGVIATDVIDRRDYLAAGFQLPVAQVWPEPVRGAHPGVLAVWVADRPVDRMKQRPTPLLEGGPLDYWGPLPWGDDTRMRELSWRLAERNSLFGGMVGSGKTLAARNVALAAALDPLVRFVISELKGSGDFDALECLCLDGMYASGADDRAKRQTMDILYWLDRECDRRGPAIRKWAVKGLNTQNKLNRAIAEADQTLFPLVAIFDELQELITDPELGKEAKRILTSVTKRARSLGIHLVLSSQRIDKESVPKGISSNISNRLCLAVPSHVETDLILGTGAYSRGARPTTFVPPADDDNPWAGWGYLAGRAQPVRASYIDNPTAEAIVARAVSLRGGVPDRGHVREPERDVLADVIRVFAHVGRPGIQWQELAELLAGEFPALYPGLTAEAISALVRAEGVPSVDVKHGGTALKGCRRTAVEEVVQRRSIGG